MNWKIIILFNLISILCLVTNESFPQNSFWEQKYSLEDYYLNIAIDSSNNIYILTAINGLLISNDFGETWSQINLPFNNEDYRDIAVDKNNHLYLSRASSVSTGILKSTDNGLTWFSLNFGTNRSASKFFVDKNGDIYAGSWEGVFKSTDYGTSWQLFYYHSNVTYFISKVDSLIFIGSPWEVYCSTNNGQNWTTKYFLVGNYFPHMLDGTIADKYFYAGTDTGLFISSDFGNSWIRKFSCSFYSVVSHFEGNIYFATSNGINFSNDAGYNIRQLNEGLQSYYAEFIELDKFGNIYTALGYDGIYKGNKSVNNLLSNFKPRSFFSPFVDGCLDFITIENKGIEQLEISQVISANPLITVIPSNATINPGEYDYFRFFSNGLPKGVYNNTIQFISNSFSSPDQLDLTIYYGVSYLIKNVDTLEFNITNIGDLITNKLEVKNIGFGILQVDSININNHNVTTDTSNFILQHDEQINILVKYTPDGLHNPDNWLVLYSNSLTSPDSVYLKFNLLSSVLDYSLLDNCYELKQNYPNPFNPTTNINYSIPKSGFVTLKVYDVLGNEVTALVNEEKLAGRYNINFDGNKLASGIYLYVLRTGDFVQSRKMLLLK